MARHVYAFASSNQSSKNIVNPLSSLSVTELKHLLSNRGIDFRDCLEKRDLVERLQESYGKGVPPSSSLDSDKAKGSSTFHRKGTHNQFSRYTDEESNIIQTFKRVAPSVAYITSSNGAPQQRRSFSLQEDPQTMGAGSGFLWDQNGHVVTNCHVVMSNAFGYNGKNNIAKTVKVKLQGMAQSYDAIVIGVEPEKDLAVLKIPAKNLPVASIIDIGTSDDLQVGQSVLAIGNPFGLDNTLTTGVVSALGRDVQGFGGRKIKGCVQTDGEFSSMMQILPF
jgi:S1-C subfamily serine protease